MKHANPTHDRGQEDASSEGPAPVRALAFSHREIKTIMVAVTLAMFLSTIDQTILGPGLPKIADELNGGGAIAWVMSSYLLGSTVATPILGKLSDLYGRKIMLQLSIICFVAMSLLCALATGMSALIGFRLLQGIGGGGMISMAFSVAADVTSPRERGRYQGYMAAGFATSAVLGPALGGLFADHLSWRWIFWINLPFGLAALAISERTLGKLRIARVRHRIDYPGALLIVAAATMTMLAITLGGRVLPWISWPIGLLGAATLLAAAICVRHEARTIEPMLPPRLFHNSTFVVSNLATFLNFVCQTGIIAYMPSFLQVAYGIDASTSGLMMIPAILILPVVGASMGWQISRTGRYKHFPLIGQITSALGAVLLAMTDGGTSHPVLILAIMLFSVGTGVGGVLLLTLQNAIEQRDLGTGTAALTFFRSLGSSFGVTLFGSIFIARADVLVGRLPLGGALGQSPGTNLLEAGPHALSIVPAAFRAPAAEAIMSAFHDVFLAAGGVSLLAFVVTLFLKELPLRRHAGGPDRPAPMPIVSAE